MRRKDFIMTKMATSNRTNILRNIVIYLFMILGLMSFPIKTIAQIKRCPICKKSISNCMYKGKHPKCSVCGYLLEKCKFKGNHPQKQPVVPIKKERTLNEIVDAIEKEMIYVEGGTYVMGAQNDDINAASYEKPAHQVTISSFYISKCEITEEAYIIVMGEKRYISRDDPANNISWEDCQAFIRNLNKLTGKTYRLPTEAEWEFAARGGKKSKGFIYSGSNNAEDVAITYNYCNSGKLGTLQGGAFRKIMLKQPNELGIYDMSGNVAEWCSDWYGAYPSSPQTNPQGPTTGKYRVIRGGSGAKTTENGKLKDCYRVTSRGVWIPSGHSETIGFRLACDL